MPDARQRAELRYQALTGPVYIVGREWQYEWYPHEVEKAIRLYSGGHKLPVIARRLDRTPWETLMLINDLAGQKRIEVREGWAWIK